MGSPADPGHGGLGHQHRLLVGQQLDAVGEAEVLHHHRQLSAVGVVLQHPDHTTAIRPPGFYFETTQEVSVSLAGRIRRQNLSR